MNKNNNPLISEKNIISASFTFLTLSLLSGAINWIYPSINTFNQVNMLGHVILGLITCILLPTYCYFHFKRIIGTRKPIVNITGIIACIILLLYLINSIFILILGRSETNSILFDLHSFGAALILIVTSIHIVAFRYIRYSKGKSNQFITIASISENKKVLHPTSLTILYFLITIIISAFFYYLQPSVFKDKPVNYDTSYGEHPFHPSQTETDNLQFIESEFISNSHTCINCHQDIAKQWSSSTHRLAAADPTYVTNVSLLAKKKGIAATRYCEGCHAPIALLTGELTPGGKHGGIANTPANHEGVNCVSCHRSTKAVHLDGVASYHFQPQRPYLFDNSKHQVLKSINHLLINLYTDQHKSDMAQSFIKEPASCATCHSQFMDKDMNNWGWVRMQDEYRAWLSSPYSKHGNPTFGDTEVKRCQDCHMPLVKANDPSSNRDGMVKSHRFAAANTMLPFLSGDDDQLQATIKFLQSNKMHISIEEPNRQDATQSKLTVDESLKHHTETPFYLYLNEKATISVTVANTGVGHNFPGGTTDINQAWVAFQVFDSEGSMIYESGKIDDNHVLDKNSHIYQSIPVDRYGEHVWKHDLFNMVGRTYKNIIEAGKTDLVKYEFDIPSSTKSPITITATLRYRKLNTPYARWALKELYSELPIVDMARDTLVVDILMEPHTF